MGGQTENHLRRRDGDKADAKAGERGARPGEILCELCGESIPLNSARCGCCGAERQPCPFCGLRFWHGTDVCPHCGASKPNPATWSLI
jgi:hypothetical protein